MTAPKMTVGADPEFFLLNENTGVVIPICGLLGGTKDIPIPMQNLPKGFFHQEDNVMAEFNIPPAKSLSAFYENITMGRQYVVEKVRTRGINVSAAPGCEYQFATTQLQDYPKAFEFGCSPDYDGYDVGMVAPVVNPEKLQEGNQHWRFAGGHIHLGYDSEIPPFIMAQFCDLYLGLNSIGYDGQKKRRSLYGNPGRYRPTPYGIEYRPLSNYWIFNTDALQIVWGGITHLETLLAYTIAEVQSMYSRIPWEDIRRAINAGDKTLGNDIQQYVSQEVRVG